MNRFNTYTRTDLVKNSVHLKKAILFIIVKIISRNVQIRKVQIYNFNSIDNFVTTVFLNWSYMSKMHMEHITLDDCSLRVCRNGRDQVFKYISLCICPPSLSFEQKKNHRMNV